MCPKLIKNEPKEKKATDIIIKYIDLPEDQYRLGNTKVHTNTHIHNTYKCATKYTLEKRTQHHHFNPFSFTLTYCYPL